MLHKKDWTMWLGECISLTAAIVLIMVSVLAFDTGMTTAHQEEAEPQEKKPLIEEEFNIPDPCAELGSWWAFMHNEEPQPREKDCGDQDANPAKNVEPMDPCGRYVFVHNAETMDLDEICELDNRDI